MTVSSAATRHAEPDQACAAAIDLARAAAEEDAGPDQVGPHVGVEADADRVVTHLFDSLNPAYVGWRWAVTVSRAARSKVITVSESLLLPGPDSLLAPPWVPWTERVRPGDLKVGDLMPASSDDERLVPFVAIAGEAGLLDWDDSDAWRFSPESPAVRAVTEIADAEGLGAEGQGAEGQGAEGQGAEGQDVEGAVGDGAVGDGAVGVGAGGPDLQGGGESLAGRPAEPPGQPRGDAGLRPGSAPGLPARTGSGLRVGADAGLRPRRVLSAIGRDEAAARWHAGEHGPRSPLASSAPATCMTCGFMIRLSGTLGRVFGVCANEFAPDDGKVVSVDHGCGAHSDGDIVADDGAYVLPAVDELGYDMLSSGATVPDSVLEKLDHELA